MLFSSALFILQLFVSSVGPVHADPLADLCRHDVRQQTMTRAKEKAPAMTAQEMERAMDGGIPSAEYVSQADTAMCVADKMRLALDKPGNFENYCFMSRAKTRVECYRHWLKKQDIAYAKQVVVLAQTGMALAKKDLSSASENAGTVMVAAIDVWLTELERYSLAKNAAFKSGSGRDRARLQSLEVSDYARAHRFVLALAERELDFLNGAMLKTPNSATPELRAAKMKLTVLGNRIAKLKQVRRDVAENPKSDHATRVPPLHAEGGRPER
jgi:hypothetical protein